MLTYNIREYFPEEYDTLCEQEEYLKLFNKDVSVLVGEELNYGVIYYSLVIYTPEQKPYVRLEPSLNAVIDFIDGVIEELVNDDF